MKRISKGARRIHEDYSRALTLRPITPDGRKTVLMMGNSLLIAAVDREKLTAKMSPEYSIALLPIENTTYLDWYFGLQRIFAEGARPSTVVLCLSPRQLMSDSVNGESFARHMMQLRDILPVARLAGLDLTQASALFFANFSDWLGDRASIRNWILETWLPNANLLVASLIPRAQATADSNQREIVAEAMHRLIRLQKMSAAHDARFVFLIPPLTSNRSLAEEIRLSAGRHGLSVLIPFLPGELAVDHFTDGFHLNSQGESVFTERLALVLESGLK
jgi:hypothetical protein